MEVLQRDGEGAEADDDQQDDGDRLRGRRARAQRDTVLSDQAVGVALDVLRADPAAERLATSSTPSIAGSRVSATSDRDAGRCRPQRGPCR